MKLRSIYSISYYTRIDLHKNEVNAHKKEFDNDEMLNSQESSLEQKILMSENDQKMIGDECR